MIREPCRSERRLSSNPIGGIIKAHAAPPRALLSSQETGQTPETIAALGHHREPGCPWWCSMAGKSAALYLPVTFSATSCDIRPCAQKTVRVEAMTVQALALVPKPGKL